MRYVRIFTKVSIFFGISLMHSPTFRITEGLNGRQSELYISEARSMVAGLLGREPVYKITNSFFHRINVYVAITGASLRQRNSGAFEGLNYFPNIVPIEYPIFIEGPDGSKIGNPQDPELTLVRPTYRLTGDNAGYVLEVSKHAFRLRLSQDLTSNTYVEMSIKLIAPFRTQGITTRTHDLQRVIELLEEYSPNFATGGKVSFTFIQNGRNQRAQEFHRGIAQILYRKINVPKADGFLTLDIAKGMIMAMNELFCRLVVGEIETRKFLSDLALVQFIPEWVVALDKHDPRKIRSRIFCEPSGKIRVTDEILTSTPTLLEKTKLPLRRNKSCEF